MICVGWKSSRPRGGFWAWTWSTTVRPGTLGGSFSAMDILTVLYFDVMRVDPKDPKDPDRDRFVLSKGHCTPALYPILAQRGYFPEEELQMFRSVEGHMSGHAEMHHVPGVDMSTGSLGQGISAAVGMALAGKLDKKDYRVYSLLGDGEIEEGQVWEAVMAAAKYKLDNLCAVIDVNGLQIDGATAGGHADRAPGQEAGGLRLARHQGATATTSSRHRGGASKTAKDHQGSSPP